MTFSSGFDLAVLHDTDTTITVLFLPNHRSFNLIYSFATTLYDFSIFAAIFLFKKYIFKLRL